MFITDTTEYTKFKAKYKIDDLSVLDDDILSLWLIGNEVLGFKETLNNYYFSIGIGKPVSDDKYREIKYVLYNSDTSKIVEEENFKAKGAFFTDNRDIINSLFKHFSKTL